MVEQLQFDFMQDFKKKYIAPDYIKFYTVYQYDRIKFKKLLRKEIARLKPKSDEEFKEIQNRILIKCYIRDEKGKRKRDTDEKHIFRYRSLELILEKLYNLGQQVGRNSDLLYFECASRCDKHYGGDVGGTPPGAAMLIMYHDEQQAEIKDSWNMPVLERIKIHIRLLRGLRNEI